MKRQRLVRMVVVAALCAPSVTALAVPAAASCVGPTVEAFPAEVDRGEQLRIFGQYFGDDCFDAGPTSEDQGVLGQPLQDLTVAVIQGGSEQILATGGASQDYSFTVLAPVPVEFEPGKAQVVVTYPGELENRHVADFVITNTPAPTANLPATDPVTFGPAITGATLDIGAGPTLVLIASGIALFLGGLLLGRRRAARTQPSSS